jgi:hypothetical protein
MKRPDLLDISKIGNFFPGVKDLLHNTGVQVYAQIFGLPDGPPFGPTNVSHLEVC